MESAVRPYIFRVLLIHLALLLAVFGIVVFAGIALYSTAEQEAETLGLERLALPANQVNNAIERHLGTVFEALTEANRVGRTAPPGLGEGPLTSAERMSDAAVARSPVGAQRLWNRLERRASDLLILDPETLDIRYRFGNPRDDVVVPPLGGPMGAELGTTGTTAPPELAAVLRDDAAARGLVEQASELVREVIASRKPRLSRTYVASESDRPVMLAVVLLEPEIDPRALSQDLPATGEAAESILGNTGDPAARSSTPPAEAVLIAALPVAYIEQNFLLPGAQRESQGMLLFDSEGHLIAGGEGDRVGMHVRDLSPEAIPPDFAEFILQTIGGSSNTQQVFEGRLQVGTIAFDSFLSLMRPIRPTAMLDTDDDEEEPEDEVEEVGPWDVFGRPDTPTARVSTSGRTERQNLWLVAILNRESVVGPLEQVTRTATLWAAGLVIAFTGILLSSAVQLIRGRSRLERLRTEMVDKELREARQIQLMWLPENEVHETGTRHIEIAAENIPASHISGDFYNYFDLPDGRCCVVIGDVTGHGMSAAFLMATTQLLVKTTLQRLGDPGRALTEVNHLLCSQAFSGQFVTIQLVIFARDRDEVLISSAGHPPPLACRPDGTWHPLAVDSDVVMGVLEDARYTSNYVELESARSLLFYTDGVVEAKNLDDERFNTEKLCERLAERLGCNVRSATSLADTTLSIIREFTEGAALEDDVTILAVHTAPTRRKEEGGGMEEDAEMPAQASSAAHR